MSLWSFEHLITVPATFAVFLIFAYLLRRLLINKPYELRMLPIKIISAIIVIIEIGKQIYSASIGYDLYHLPLHFCSIFLYALPLMAFYRGRWESAVRSTACAAMTALLIGMLIIPNVIYGADRILSFFTDYLAFHTVVFHNLVILAFILMLFLDLHQPQANRSEALFVGVFGAVFVAVSATASHVLQTNFSNFLSSTIGIVADLVDKVKEAIGSGVTNVLYTVIISALHVALLVGTYYLYGLIRKLSARVFKKSVSEK